MKMKVSWEGEGKCCVCVCVLSDPSCNICGPMVEIRSLMPLTAVCLVPEGLFAASHTEHKFARQQLA